MARKTLKTVYELAEIFYKTAKISVGNEFFNKLKEISKDLGIDPKDLLLIMVSESGLNPGARNAGGGAAGINQMMPSTLLGLGFGKDLTPDQRSLAYSKLKGEDQLEYFKKYLEANKPSTGYRNAVDIYLANALPVCFSLPGIRSQDPNAIICTKNKNLPQTYPNISKELETKYYDGLSLFDINKDGSITYGDFVKYVNGLKNNSTYLEAVGKLQSSDGTTQELSSNDKPVESTELTELPEIPEVS
jgi:hypothetical protein